MVSSCGHDERRKYSGGKAGDQTGTEWYNRSWYNGNWNCVIRFPENIANELATLAERASANNLIGYDQGQRLTYYDHLKASKWNPSGITIACEADCSAGVSANIIAVGYRLGISNLQGFSKSNTTRTIKNACKAVGATILTESKYLTSDKYLKRGDLPLKEGGHIVTNLSNGSSVSTPVVQNPQPTGTSANALIKIGQQHSINFTGHAILVDGIKGAETDNQKARVLQYAMNLDYNSKLTVDGLFQTKSKNALGSHYVKKGERQYMVTAAEILMYLNGVDPSGVECPGKYGNGLTNAAKVKFSGDGTRISASNFLTLIS